MSAIADRFFAQLPFEICVMGRDVLIEAGEESSVSVFIADRFVKARFDQSVENWLGRRGFYTDSSELRATIRATRDILWDEVPLRAFVGSLFNLPIGLKLCTFADGKTHYDYPGRIAAVNELYLSWGATNFWPKNGDGKLLFSMPCSGYRSRIAWRDRNYVDLLASDLSNCLCAAITSSPTGLCASHRKSTARTLSNYYPFFEAEGMPEFAEERDVNKASGQSE